MKNQKVIKIFLVEFTLFWQLESRLKRGLFVFWGGGGQGNWLFLLGFGRRASMLGQRIRSSVLSAPLFLVRGPGSHEEMNETGGS